MASEEAWIAPGSEVGLAARNGNYKKLKRLITEDGSPTDVADSRGWRPLHEASVTSSGENVRCLVELLKCENINVDCQTKNGETALLLACKHGVLQAVHEILRAGANVNVTDNESVTPLLAATRSGRIDIALALLDTRKADTNLGDHEGWRPLHKAVVHDQVDLARELLGSGAKLDVQTIYGITPLYNAVTHRKLECVKLLLEAALSEHYHNPLRNEPNVMELFASAAKNGFEECIKLFLPYTSSTHRAYVLHIIIEQKNHQLLKWLLQNMNVLHISIEEKDHQLLKWVLQNMDIDALKNKFHNNQREPSGTFNPVGLAVRYQSCDCLRIILEKGFPVDSLFSTQHMDLEDEIGTSLPELITPLAFSLRRNNIEMAKMLLSAGANSNPCGDHVFPPLYSAILNGNSDAIDLLLEHDADFRNRGLLLVAITVPKNLCHLLRRGANPMLYFTSNLPFFADAIFNRKRQKDILKVSQTLLAFLDRRTEVSSFFSELAEKCRERFQTEYDTESWSRLLDTINSPPSLASSCRIFVRHHLRLHGTSLGDRIDLLQPHVTPPVISYLHYKDILF